MLTVTSKDGTSIAYNKTGTGPALIIVTGATAGLQKMRPAHDNDYIC